MSNLLNAHSSDGIMTQETRILPTSSFIDINVDRENSMTTLFESFIFNLHKNLWPIIMHQTKLTLIGTRSYRWVNVARYRSVSGGAVLTAKS